MVARIVKSGLLTFVLSTSLATAATVADDQDRQRIQQLEQKVQALEKQVKNLEALVIEFADELALLNIKVMELERRAGIPVK
mgnify:CR=1 FL=1